jgi:hypothetical protein
MEAAIAVTLSMGAATHDDPTDSLDYLSIAIRHYYDAGSISLMHNPLGHSHLRLRPARTP